MKTETCLDGLLPLAISTGDGYADLIVGGPGESPGPDPQSGAVFVFAGSPVGLTQGRFLTQADAEGMNEDGDLFGSALTTGDFNADGFDDLVVGAPGEAPFPDPQSGAVFVFTGSSAGLTQGTYLTQSDAGGMNETGDLFGASLVAGTSTEMALTTWS